MSATNQSLSSAWRHVYVFVSSTFNDMHGERDHLVKHVFPRLREWCEPRRLRLVDVDLRWGVTEQDARHHKNVVQACLHRIDECRPFFVCLLGQKYGWVPQSEDVSEETLRRYPGAAGLLGRVSVTELEIVHAWLRPMNDQGAPCAHAFFYVRDPASLDSLPDHPHLRAIYSDRFAPDRELGLAAQRRRQRLVERLQATVPERVRGYSAFWNPRARSPELELPLACGSAYPDSVARWQQAWRTWAAIDVDSLVIDGQSPIGERARRYNDGLATGRFTDFRCGDQPLADRLLEDLKQAIARQYPENADPAPSGAADVEWAAHERLQMELSERFVERPGVFDELDAYVDRSDRRPLLVLGGAGAGKSATLAAWLRHRRSSAGDGLPPGPIIVARFGGTTRESSTIYDLLRSVLVEVARHRRGDLDLSTDPEALVEEFAERLSRAAAGRAVVLVIDGLDKVEDWRRDLAWISSPLPDAVKLVISLREADSCGPAFRWLGTDELMARTGVKPLETRAERVELIQSWLWSYLKQLDRWAADAIANYPGAANPLFLEVILSELRVFGSFDNLAGRIRKLFGSTPESAFDAVLGRLENDAENIGASPETVVRTFALLAHARRGLSLEALEQLVGLVAADGSARDTVLRLLRQVQRFLLYRDGLYRFRYESFRAAAADRYAPADRWHAALCAHFASQPPYVDGVVNQRRVDEVVFQATNAGQHALARTLLTDFDNVAAALSAGGGRDWLKQIESAVEVAGDEFRSLGAGVVDGKLVPHVVEGDPLHVLSDFRGFGRRNVGFLHENPDQLLFAALNDSADGAVHAGASERLGDDASSERPWLRRVLTPSRVDSDRLWEKPFEAGIVGITLCDDEQTLVSSLLGCGLVSSDADSGRRQWSMSPTEAPGGGLGSIARFVVASGSSTALRIRSQPGTPIEVWDRFSRRPLHTLDIGRVVGPAAVALSADGRTALLASFAETVSVIDVSMGTIVRDIAVGNTVHGLTLSSDGGAAAAAAWRDGPSGRSAGEVLGIDVTEGVVTLRAPFDEPSAVCIDGTGHLVVAASLSGAVRAWDLRDGATIEVRDPDPALSWSAVVLDAEGRHLACAGSRKWKDARFSRSAFMETYTVTSGLRLGPLGAHSATSFQPHGFKHASGAGAFLAVQLSADGQRAWTRSDTGMVIAWDRHAVGNHTSAHQRAVQALALAGDGSAVVSAPTVGPGYAIHIEQRREVRLQDYVRRDDPPSPFDDVVEAGKQRSAWVCVTADGARFLFDSWRMAPTDVRFREPGNSELQGDPRFVGMGDLQGACAWLICGHGEKFRAAALSPEGRWLYGARHHVRGDLGEVPCISRLDLETGHRKELAGTDMVAGVWVSLDARWLVTTGDSLRLWDARDGRLIAELTTEATSSATFLPDGRHLAAGHAGQVTVWDIGSHRCVRRFRVGGVPVLSVAALADCRHVLAADGGPTLGVWAIRDGSRAAVYHDRAITHVAAACGRVVYGTAGGDLGILVPTGFPPAKCYANPLRRWVHGDVPSARRDPRVVATCPGCGVGVSADENYLGREATCPACHGGVTFPRVAGATPEPGRWEDPVRAACPHCRSWFPVLAEMLGTSGVAPCCRGPVHITDTVPVLPTRS